jgi:hypothetical protein
MAGLLGGVKLNDKTEILSEKNYTLEGLIDVIQMKHKDVFHSSNSRFLYYHWGVILAGKFCTNISLNLDLNSTNGIYGNLMSLFGDVPTLGNQVNLIIVGAEPTFSLPPCYTLAQSLPPTLTRLHSFTDETLFYIFYSSPRSGIFYNNDSFARRLESRVV